MLKLAGKFTPAKTPSLKVGDNLVTNHADVAECLGRHLSEVSSSKNYTAEFQRIRDTQVVLDLSGGDHEAYNSRFSLHELHNALSSTEDTSPGEDTILYDMFRQLPDEAKSYLLLVRHFSVCAVVPIFITLLGCARISRHVPQLFILSNFSSFS